MSGLIPAGFRLSRLPFLGDPARRHFVNYHLVAPAARLLRGLSPSALVAAEHQPVRFAAPDRETFFGYYDTTPLHGTEPLLLAHAAPGLVRNPGPGDELAVGLFERDRPDRFRELDRSAAWCWQMGARLRWFPDPSARQLTYNKPLGERFGAVIRSLDRPQEAAELPAPLYDLSSDGAWALSLDFARLDQLRPGYGYAPPAGARMLDPCPRDNGVWRVDLARGTSDLLFSLRQLAAFAPVPDMADAWHYVNHLSIAPDGNRFLFFHAWLPERGAVDAWRARIFVAERDGSGLRLLSWPGRASHYCWRDGRHALVFCYSTEVHGRGGYRLFDTDSGSHEAFWPGLPDFDGHQSFSPDGRFLLTDSYPDRTFEQKLLLFGADGSARLLGAFRPAGRYRGDWRCDLHPRWSASGREVLFDSAHEGRRGLYLLDLVD